MNKEEAREKIRLVLQEIQDSVPKNLRTNVVREVKSTPTIEMVMNHALTDENIKPELKAKIKRLSEAGEFSKTKVEEDPVIAKKIDNYVLRKINEAVKSGRLPNRRKLKALGLIK
jgi:hypothetical protein